MILVIEDDPEIRDHLSCYWADEGYRVATAVDGPAALAWIAGARDTARSRSRRLQSAEWNDRRRCFAAVRKSLDRLIPCVILTGDISTHALRDIALHDCVQFNKPIKLAELVRAIDNCSTATTPAGVRPARVVERAGISRSSTIYVVDDDDQVRDGLGMVLEDDGRAVEAYRELRSLPQASFCRIGCLLIDAYLPGMRA